MSLQSKKMLILTALSFSLRSAAEKEVEARSVGREVARPLTTEKKRKNYYSISRLNFHLFKTQEAYLALVIPKCSLSHSAPLSCSALKSKGISSVLIHSLMVIQRAGYAWSTLTGGRCSLYQNAPKYTKAHGFSVLFWILSDGDKNLRHTSSNEKRKSYRTYTTCGIYFITYYWYMTAAA